jgi:hypothetical protein
VNHAFIVGTDGQIVEATLTGVHVSDLSKYAGCLAFSNLGDPMTAEQGMEVWSAALGMCGDLYNYTDLLAIGFADLGWVWKGLFKVLGAGPWRICSQLVVLAGQKASPPFNWLCREGMPDEVTPAALARRPGVVPVTFP